MCLNFLGLQLDHELLLRQQVEEEAKWRDNACMRNDTKAYGVVKNERPGFHVYPVRSQYVH